MASGLPVPGHQGERCPECLLPERTDAESLPPIQASDEELVGWHQWARGFDLYARQVPAGDAYSALDFIHWIVAERRLRSEPRRQDDRREHIREGARRRWERNDTPT